MMNSERFIQGTVTTESPDSWEDLCWDDSYGGVPVVVDAEGEAVCLCVSSAGAKLIAKLLNEHFAKERDQER
jgi:hypothetical protein